MIKLDKNSKTATVTVQANIKSKRQWYLLGLLVKQSPKDALSYLQSLNGVKTKSDAIKQSRFELKYTAQDLLSAKREYSVLRALNLLCDTEATHKPTTSSLGDWIGVEIECIVPHERFHDEDYRYNCECYCASCETEEEIDNCECDYCSCEPDDSADGYRSRLGEYLQRHKIKRCTVKADGSIDEESGYFGAELTIVFNRNDREPLKKLCNALNKIGAKVNKSCGLHVHLDQRDVDPISEVLFRRVNNLSACLPLFAKLVPKSRRNNSYCQLSTSKYTGDRYHAINCTTVRTYGTIEVRLHSSTTDFKKINNWIDLLLIVSRHSYALGSPIDSIEDLRSKLAIPRKLIAYFKARLNKFRLNANEDAFAREVA